MNSPWIRICAGLIVCIGFATSDWLEAVSSADAAIDAGGRRTIEVTGAVSHPNAGSAVGVIYLRIVNHSNRDDRLIAAHTTAAGEAAFHETVLEGEFVRMKHRPRGFEIAAGGEIVLESGGKHIMLTQLKGPLVDGGSIELELIFEHADKVLVKVPIRPRM